MARSWLAFLIVFVAGCTERALEIPADAGSHDLRKVDLAGYDAFDLAITDLATNPCPAGTEFIFVVDDSGNLSRFNPVTSQFFDVGHINCPASSGDSINSMAIDRDGRAYVTYRSGALFDVDTKTAACSSTAYKTNQFGFRQVGMSFAQEAAGSVAERLWITSISSGNGRLASIDLNTFKLSMPVTLPIIGDGELTGDNDGNLWGFFPDSSTVPLVARIDKQTGALDHQRMLSQLAGPPQAWGFAAWKKDFYIFLQRGGEPSTQIYLLDGTTGSLTTVVGQTGRSIVGVGVATCAGNGISG